MAAYKQRMLWLKCSLHFSNLGTHQTYDMEHRKQWSLLLVTNPLMNVLTIAQSGPGFVIPIMSQCSIRDVVSNYYTTLVVNHLISIHKLNTIISITIPRWMIIIYRRIAHLRYMIVHFFTRYIGGNHPLLSEISLTAKSQHIIVNRLLLSSAALFSWKYFVPLVRSVVQAFVGRPRDLLNYIFPSISCSCDEICFIRCHRYGNFHIRQLKIYVPV